MYLKKVDGPRAVTLPDGQTITRADLPPPDTRRWVASRKLSVVRGVVYGLISQDEALVRYGLAEDTLPPDAQVLDTPAIRAILSTYDHILDY